MNEAENLHSVHAVIVDYDSAEDSRICIDALMRMELPPAHIWVVINGDDAAWQDWAREAVTLLRPGRNSGFAGGCNIGMAKAFEAGADHVLLINPDSEPVGELLSPLLKALENDPKAALAVPTIYSDTVDGPLWYAGAVWQPWLGRTKHIRDDRLMRSGDPVAVPFATGCCWLLRKSAYDALGPMDERYFLYFEDADYGMHAQSQGWRLLYVPEARLVHRASASTGFQSETYLYYFARNRTLFMKRWAVWAQRVVFSLWTWGVKLPVVWLFFAVVKRRWKLAMAFTRGLWHGCLSRNGQGRLS